jgi:zinc D-Ala-D-Ala carboxypeptidase
VNLSPHFTFDELTSTGHANLQAKNREEAKAKLPALTALAEMLEAVRAHFGKPLKVNSAFRGPSVNAAVGGSKTSQHMLGEAADFSVVGVDDAEVHRWICTASGLKFGQCILERPPGRSWVHLSLGAPWRPAAKCGQALTYNGKDYLPWKA